MTYLNKLKLTTVSRERTADPVLRRREKLLEKLSEQRNAAQHFLEGKVFTPTKKGWVIDEETGEKSLIEKPKKVRPWYWETGGVWYLQVRYGAKPIEIGNGKPSIEVGAKEEVLNAIDVCISAVKAGELDKQLTALAGDAAKKLRKSKTA